MSYATAADLLLWFGAKELAQCAVPDDMAVVSAELMRLTIGQGDRDDFSPEEIAAADVGLAVLDRALSDAEKLLHSYLAGRFALPLSDEQVAQSALPRVCGAVARRFLHHDRVPEEASRGYEMALSWLTDLAVGRAELTALPMVTRAGLAAFDAGERVFDQETLRGFA